MSVKRRQFTSRFKAKVVMEAMKGQRTIGELAGLYQVHPSRIAAGQRNVSPVRFHLLNCCPCQRLKKKSYLPGSGRALPG